MTVKTQTHTLVPVHKKLTEQEKDKLLQKYGITVKELPKILKSDMALSHLDVEPGDVIGIQRKSPTAGTTLYYRVVIRG